MTKKLKILSFECDGIFTYIVLDKICRIDCNNSTLEIKIITTEGNHITLKHNKLEKYKKVLKYINKYIKLLQE